MCPTLTLPKMEISLKSLDLSEDFQFPPLTSHQSILTYDRFCDLYEGSKQTLKECAGLIILNEELTHILLVKGCLSKKWGCPKGHAESLETNLETAIRE